MLKFFLVAIFFFLSYQVSTNCNASQGANVLNTEEECEDLDKCSIDCSNFVPNCYETADLGINLNTEYSEKVFNFVCRNDYYKQRDSVQNAIMGYVRQRALELGFTLIDITTLELYYQGANDNNDPSKLTTYNYKNLDHPLQALWVFGRFFSLFGDLCRKNFGKKKGGKNAMRNKIIKMINDYNEGKNIFKLREGTTKTTLWAARETMKKYYFRSQTTRIINGVNLDKEILDREYKNVEAKMIGLLSDGKKKICPCNLLMDFSRDFHDTSNKKVRKAFYDIEGWKYPDQCKAYANQFYNTLLLSQKICKNLCKSQVVISIPDRKKYQKNLKDFRHCYNQSR